MQKKSNIAAFSDIDELLYSNAIEGEVQIAYFRFSVILVAISIVVAIALGQAVLSPSEYADFYSITVALIYNFWLIWLLKKKNYYRRYLGFISTTIDVAIISAVIYFARYGVNSSVASIMSTGAFVVYLPIIVFSLRRHDRFNSLYAGCLAGIVYFGMIVIIEREGAFSVPFVSNTGLIVEQLIYNECAKPVFLVVAGFLGFVISKNYDSVLHRGIETETEKERIKHLLDIYASPELVEKILNNEIPMEGEKREITIMFVDIRDFTSLCERIEPKILVQVLSGFFNTSEEIIVKYKGFIDKFVGDEIMVLFGAPLPLVNHREQAVMCAIELHDAIANYSQRLGRQQYDCTIEVGIGINSGEVVIGNTGSENRKNFTALGDAVNVASRIEKLTRGLNKNVLMGESVYLEDLSDLTEGPISVRIKGKTNDVKVYPLKL